LGGGGWGWNTCLIIKNFIIGGAIDYTIEFNRADFTLFRYERGDGFNLGLASSFPTFGKENSGILFKVA
jgi:hypothetical protein